MFYAQQHGFDSHFKYLKPGSLLSNTLKEVDDAIKAFETQMKAEGIWDDVLVVSASDFGRKLVSVDDVYVCDCVCVCVCVCVQSEYCTVQYSVACLLVCACSNHIAHTLHLLNFHRRRTVVGRITPGGAIALLRAAA